MIPFRTLRSSVSGSVSIGTQNLGGTKLTVLGDSNIRGNAFIEGDLTVTGNLTALGNFINLDTIVSVTSALSVINVGSGPGLVVDQRGNNSIIDFRDDGSSVFFIADGGNVGIKNTNPAAALDVTGTIRTKDHSTSVEWYSTYTTVSAFSARWGTGGVANLGNVPTVSALWTSVYTTVSANSSTWGEVVNVRNRVSNLEVISARLWDSVYTTVSAFSASWGIVPPTVNLTEVSVTSSLWNSVYLTVSGLSANLINRINDNTGRLESLEALSASWNSVRTQTNTLSSWWQSTYTTVSAFSGEWSDIVNVRNRVSNLEVISARLWNSVYTTVSAFSASWGAGTSIVAVISSVVDNISGSQIKLGTPEDGSWTQCGAYQRWDAARTITDAIDDLNEVIENVRNNTFVKSVFFDGTPTTGGAGMTVTLNIAVTGNANFYQVNWGDGTPTQNYTTSTPSKVYSSNTGSPFTIALSAFNNNGCGAGSFSNAVRTGYIIVFTANPVSQFNLYRNEVGPGGTILTGNNLYVRTSLDTLYLENTSLNTTPAAATYTIYWDGTNTTPVANNGAAGGVGGPRAPRSYSVSSGTGTVPVNLAVISYTTANPAIFPVNGTQVNLKVYNSAIATPQDLSFKTFSNSTAATVGNLCAGYNTNGISSPPGAGTSTNRYTTGSFSTTNTDTIAYYANNSVVSLLVNGSVPSGSSKTMLGAGGNVSNNGTNFVLSISEDSDYNLFDATGTATTFANSIYYPGLYRGFRAAANTSTVNNFSIGLNSLQFQYQLSPNPAIVSSTRLLLTRDDVTSIPTVDASTTTISEQASPVFRYVSGIPYYNTGSAITITGLRMYNWLGQVYSTNANAPLFGASDNVLEGTGSIIQNIIFSYTQVDNPANTYLTGGIPNANTGKTISTPYTLRNLSVSVNPSTAAAGRLRFRGTNMNGTGTFTTVTDKIIQVFTAAPAGFVEDGFSTVPGSSFGSAKRIRIVGATGGTPAYNSATDYYSNTPFTGLVAVNIAGTDEAVVRYGSGVSTQQLRHFAVDLSTGYLPVGYNLATGRSGTQYFRAALKRTTGQNFTFAIAGKISGFWIAAPGTAIDTTSTLNGWLDGNLNYQGSGTPGANSGPGGSNGCATGVNGVIPLGSVLVATTPYTLTLGDQNLSFGSTKQLLISIALASTDYVNSLTITGITG